MRRAAEWFGRFDDESVIYSASDDGQRVAWRRLGATWAVGSLLVAALAWLGRAVGNEAGVMIALLVGLVAFLVGYVIWRRRRNTRLTGSPTTWPTRPG